MSLSLSSLAFSTSFDQWDSGLAAAVFVHQACVTANIASDQASAAEDKLQHSLLDSWRLSFSQLVSEPSEVPQVWTKRSEDVDEND